MQYYHWKRIMETNNDVTNSWKIKAITRGKRTKVLNKRIRELISSRDNWKEKYICQKQEADKLREQVLKIKKKMKELIQK